MAEKSRNSRDSEVTILAGQTEVYGAKDEETILTARTSQKPKKFVLPTLYVLFFSWTTQKIHHK